MPAQATIPTMFYAQVQACAERSAFYYCPAGSARWQTKDWRTHGREVATAAAWLQQQGMGKGSKIAIMSANCPEWIQADLAILSIGAVSVPVYPNVTVTDLSYIVEHAGAEMLVVDKLTRIANLPPQPFKAIVTFEKQFDRRTVHFDGPIYSLPDILETSQARLTAPATLQHDDLATIIYTSGTTGKPKGVMHTHGNFISSLQAITPILDRPAGSTDRYFSFLPLSHVAERLLIEVGALVNGSEIAFARSLDHLAEDLTVCRPTILFCVPRLWEKIYEKIQATIAAASPVKRNVFKLAQALGSRRINGDVIVRDKPLDPGVQLSDALVGKKLRRQLGLDRTRMLITGAAPIRPDVQRFFASFGLLIREVYGLTENMCLGVLNDNDRAVIGSCGKAFIGNEIKIAPDGEILFRAPWMFKGYYKDPQNTADVLLPDGWLATGDMGQLGADGHLRIVGRKKELLKTSGGKYVAPVPIEDKLKASGLIKDAMVVGDNRKYCLALITLDPDVLAKTPRADLVRDLDATLHTVNATLASFESVKKLGVLKDGFSIENGRLTPSLKLRRSVLEKEVKGFIDRLYETTDVVSFET